MLSYLTVQYGTVYIIGPKTQCENESKYREKIVLFLY